MIVAGGEMREDIVNLTSTCQILEFIEKVFDMSLII